MALYVIRKMDSHGFGFASFEVERYNIIDLLITRTYVDHGQAGFGKGYLR
jgi:hypothetical protein